MARNLILLFDGTWNKRSTRTNVIRMRESIDSSGRDDARQPVFYDEGVGTKWWNRLSGGAFGRGLSENIMEGHAWLSRRHVAGDAIFVFGFSRGAYTARSLVGLIRKCGLLNSVTPETVKQAYELYRDKAAAPDDAKAAEFRTKHSRETRVRYIGVWDTVGALGIPISQIPFSRDFYQWHDTELSRIVDYAIHAVAVDEHRRDFAPTLWSKAKPENVKVEQRWFAGAHSDVGGGEGGALPNLALRWLQDTAEEAGLIMKKKVEVGAEDYSGKITDSFASFMFGIYKFFKKPHQRVFGAGANEVVDDSVWQRWRADPSYRPPALAKHPQKPSP
ncbi:MAG: DUF2235 domain-containing protein [Gammaproteobacteria bacterium]